MMNAEDRISSAWNFIFEKLVHPNTHQIYDYRTTENADGAFVHLPTPEEIAACIPNPCGWFTGMEDSDICGSIAMDTVLVRYELTRDASLKQYSDELYKGLILNTKVSPQKGFLARAVHPADQKSHYINSSRDQYTHWIYSMSAFRDSELSDKIQKEEINAVLIAFAEKAEHDVTEENEFSLLREDGKPALVCRMIGEKTACHETNRLPMIYLAAFVASGDNHWLELYKEYRESALAIAETIELVDMSFFKHAFALHQMQLSLRFLYDHDTDEDYRARYKALMHRVAEGSEKYIYPSLDAIKSTSLPKVAVSWRSCPEEFVAVKKTSHGYDVLMPDVHSATNGKIYWPLRDATDGVITQCLCPDFSVKPEQIRAFSETLASVDVSKGYSHAAAAFCGAYWALKKHLSL